MTKNRMAGLTIFILGAIFVYMTSRIPNPSNMLETGPRLFPYISSAGMVICGIGLVFQKSKETDAKPFMRKAEWVRLAKITAVLIVYAAALYALGYIISTPLAFFALMKILSSGKKISVIKLIIVSLFMTALLYILFEKALLVVLPRGILF